MPDTGEYCGRGKAGGVSRVQDFQAEEFRPWPDGTGEP